MCKTLVSILIPTYNRERLIEETIRSALAQTYQNIEVVVVDNASSDDSWKVISSLAKEDSRVRPFRNEENVGPMRNWKRCFDEARGEYGKILWSDDLISSDFLEKTIPLLGDKDTAFVFTAAVEFDDATGREICTRYRVGPTGKYPASQFIRESLLFGDFPYSPGCALFRMADLRTGLEIDIPNRLGADFSMLAIGNDLLLFLNAAARYSEFAFVNEPLSRFRHHSGSITVNSGNRQIYYSAAKAHFLSLHTTSSGLAGEFRALLMLVTLALRVRAKTKFPSQMLYPPNVVPPSPRWTAIPALAARLIRRL